MTETRLLTADDLERMGDEAERYELIFGIPRETEPMGGRHGEIQVGILGPLFTHVIANHLGRLYTADTHFVLLRDPDLTLMPDIAFVRAERLPPIEQRQGFMRLVPDLAVEVASPSDRGPELLAKVALYQRAGVPLVWLVQPRPSTVTVFALGQAPRTLQLDDTLDGGEVLPGFALPVAAIFA